MKKDLEELFASAKKISLTDIEKTSILNTIVGTSTPENVRNISSPRLYTAGGVATLTDYYSRWSVMRYRNTLTSFAFIIALLGTTGAYAQMSLPGELLYPIKIHVGEKLEYVVAITPRAQAIVEATFATRRLEEATALLYTHKLTESRSTELAAEFSVYSEKLIGHLGELRKNGNEEEANKIHSSFEASLQTHQEVLNVFQASSSLNENLFNKNEGTSTKINSSVNQNTQKESQKNKPTNEMITDRELAPFVTTPSELLDQEHGTANIRATNTVEVLPSLEAEHIENMPSIIKAPSLLNRLENSSKQNTLLKDIRHSKNKVPKNA